MNCAPGGGSEAISRSEPVQLLEEERLRKEIAELRAKIERVPFIDTFDLRYKITKTAGAFQPAVMFCLMDVSGSMDQPPKTWPSAFISCCICSSAGLIKTSTWSISATIPSKEVDEHEFFYSQETGGTIVSSALKLMDEVVQARYDPAQWNIYAARASDGDNWADDSAVPRTAGEENSAGGALLQLYRNYPPGASDPVARV